MKQLNKTVSTIVITGGSNAGKSSIMGFLVTELPKYGIKPFILHEVATNLFTAGISHEEVSNTQELIVKKMISDEDILKNAALNYNGKLRPVLFCDRGIKDCEVYCKPGEFSQILEKLNLTDQQIKDRYTAVIHLRTTAKGAPDVFMKTFGDNPVRIEKSLEEVAHRDTLTENSWIGSRQLFIIPNRGDFNDKKYDALRAILRSLGMPVPQPIQYKFLVVSEFNPQNIGIPYETDTITQYYLNESPMRLLMNYPRDASSIIERIRITENRGHCSYSYTLKAFVPGENFPYELHAVLSQDEFVQLMLHHTGRPLKKQRTYFTWNDQYFQYDKFSKPIDNLNSSILEVRPSEEHPNVILPDFIPYGKDVTQDPWYQNSAIAERLL